MLNDRANKLNVKLQLDDDELYQFYWNIYGSSLVEYPNTPKVKEGYNQLLKNIEDFLIQKNPDNIFKLEIIKNNIRESISKRKTMN